MIDHNSDCTTVAEEGREISFHSRKRKRSDLKDRRMRECKLRKFNSINCLLLDFLDKAKKGNVFKFPLLVLIRKEFISETCCNAKKTNKKSLPRLMIVQMKVVDEVKVQN